MQTLHISHLPSLMLDINISFSATSSGCPSLVVDIMARKHLHSVMADNPIHSVWRVILIKARKREFHRYAQSISKRPSQLGCTSRGHFLFKPSTRLLSLVSAPHFMMFSPCPKALWFVPFKSPLFEAKIIDHSLN